MKRILFSFLLFSTAFFSAFSQTSLRIMQYNLLYYGSYPSWCPITGNNPDFKDAYLKTLVDYIHPDVFCVNELGAGNTNASRILENVLNSDNPGKYERGLSTNNGFSDIVNMLYFNTEKLVLYSQEQVTKDSNNNALARIIDLYTLYFKDADLAQSNDTIFITFIVAHLKAGSSSANQLSRALETEALMEHLNGKDTPANYIFSGDFNVRSSNETSFVNLVSNTNPALRFYDPINQLGTWYNNSDFASIHTQSTRVVSNTNNGCFASGGTDDRFDFILVSQAINNDLLKVKYVTDSHTIPGQDGNRFKQSVTDPPNISAPQNVINAIYEMSDHYPVYLDLEVDAVLSNKEKVKRKAEITFINPVTDFLELKINCFDCNLSSVEITNLGGKLVLKENLSGGNGIFFLKSDVMGFEKGMYLIKIINRDGSFFSRKMIKNH
ncbi:MAG: T9SS type A sorting domain-containing protein [Bacteroidetes bacterium]|nr:T9SS type A sorting domain-containing protein [Bacteroidota bacterium]HET6245503.1 T9SS type A sorting domain-containing protein [Bacteroidia bacterium]